MNRPARVNEWRQSERCRKSPPEGGLLIDTGQTGDGLLPRNQARRRRLAMLAAANASATKP